MRMGGQVEAEEGEAHQEVALVVILLLMVLRPRGLGW